MTTEPIEGQILESMPTANPQTTALVATSNPFERMAMVAMETGRGVDQLEKLLDLQIKWDAEQARKAYVAAMAEFKKEPMEILKRKLVEFTTRDGDTTSYKHEELADVTDVVVPAMAKHGLSHDWSIDQDGGTITVSCTITHRDGHSGKPVTMKAAPDASGKKNAIQQVASAIKYMQRYTLLAATGMASKSDRDDDGRGYDSRTDDVEYISDAQLATLTDLADAYIPKGTKRDEFLNYVSKNVGFTVTTLGEIPAASFDAVHEQIKKIRDKKVAGHAS